MDKLIRNVALYTYDPHHNEGNLLRRDVDSTAAAVETTTFEAALSNNLNSVKTLYIPFPLSFLPELFFKIQKKFWNVYIPRVKFNISTFPFSLLLLPFFLFLNIQRYVYNTSLRSIVHIKRISCPSSPTFNVQPSPLSNAGYRRRLTFHGRYSTTQLLFPLEFIPPSLAPLLRSYSKFREIERGWKEEKEREKKLETRRKGGGRAWLEATIGIEIRCMGAGRRGGNGPFTRVYMRRHWNIGFATDAHHIRGKIFQRLSTSARVHRPMRPNVLCHRIFTLVKRTPQVYFLSTDLLFRFFFFFFPLLHSLS